MIQGRDGEPLPGEVTERAYCKSNGLPWARLTPEEQDAARCMLAEVRHAGHPRLSWEVPRDPWPLGAVWPCAKLFGLPVRHRDVPRVRLMARTRLLGRRHLVAELYRAGPVGRTEPVWMRFTP
ncbi:MAG: hypothetical protein ACRDTZ_10155 [Pseudonocardiaceae bacterium]